ncbi:trace amine-associated receptor 1-like [Erpetoichthys calabaricus]|uniref:trace amine-associated receptor 1-like n=1 Tax=Erpetoichthys calabaricus TaxID=27687 RepID=UPI00223443FF|nr:trace amine-associated receptor 1-like [Erpetoichthys calabaricus]
MDRKLHYCYSADNTSCAKVVRKHEEYVMLYIFSVFVIIVTLCGNIFVIISISHFKQLHTPTNCLVLSLAAVDFLLGLFVMPFHFAAYIEYCWYFGEFMCYYFYLMYLFLTSASVSNLVFISVDRYLAVCNPFFYTSNVTIFRTMLCIAIGWLSALSYTLAYLKSDGSTILTGCAGACGFDFLPAWGMADFLCTFVLPFSVISCFYFRIFIVARRHARAINLFLQKKPPAQLNSKTSLKSETKAARTLGIVVVVFMICWFPQLVLAAYFLYAPVPDRYISTILSGLTLISLINSGINPVIYAFFYPWFQQCMKLIVSRKIFCPGSSVINLFSESSH